MKSLIVLSLTILITAQNGGRVVIYNPNGQLVLTNAKINGTLAVRPPATVRPQ